MPPATFATTNPNDSFLGGVEPLVTAEQLAAAFQVSVRTVHNWAHAGTIPVALRIGKVVRFALSEVAMALRTDAHCSAVNDPKERPGETIA